ncbi:MAG TPA: hypothetical protein VG125_14170, partial [Pirellulales bacterium]|nr:hypothetical protein [Pirellulales bacterium]
MRATSRKRTYAYDRLLRLEPLERRTLLAISVQNIPSYEQQGPGPITGGQSDVHNNEVAGAINDILVQDPNHIFVATVNGGIWKTDNGLAAENSTFFSPQHVEWTSLTDQYGSLSVDSLAALPGNNNVIYAGIGDNSSASSVGGAKIGVLRSTDDGNTWQLLADAPPASSPGGTVLGALPGGVPGKLQPGSYFLQYTYTSPKGESTPSLESNSFTVKAGEVPELVLPSLPQGVTGINIYLSPTDGASGSESLRILDPAPHAPTQTPPATNTTKPAIPDPSAPGVDPVGGGVTGGGLPAGDYLVQYTWVDAKGNETLASPATAIPVAPGAVPLLSLPSLPPSAVSANIYLTPAGGGAGSEVLYASNVSGPTVPLRQPFPLLYDLSTTIASEPPNPPTSGEAGPTALAIDPTGGGATGGNLPPGDYWAVYTWTRGGGETSISPEVKFHVDAGNVPRMTLDNPPLLSPGANIYLTAPNGPPHSETFYAGGVKTTTFDLSAPLNPTSPPPTVNTLPPNGQAPPPDPARGGLTGLNVVRIVPTSFNTDGTLNTQIVLAATNGGVFLSQDGGQTWSPESGRAASGLPAGAVSDMVLDDGSFYDRGQVIYAALPGQGIFKASLLGTHVVIAGGHNVVVDNTALTLPLTWTRIDGPANITAPPSTNTTKAPAQIADPTLAPTVVVGPAGVGGSLQPGTYFVKYNWVGPGATLASPESAQFTVTSLGQIPQVLLPPPPAGVTSANIFLTATNGLSGTEFFYSATAVNLQTFNLTAPQIANTGVSAQVSADPPFETDISQTARIDLAVHDSSDGDEIYAALVQQDLTMQTKLGSNSSFFFYGIFRSIDQGATWQSMGVPSDGDGPVDPGGQMNQQGAIVADPANADVLYVAGDLKVGTHLNAISFIAGAIQNDPEGNLFRGRFSPFTGQTSWQPITGYHVGDPVSGKPHADDRRLVISGQYLYTATDGGIYEMNNDELDPNLDSPSWKSLNGNMFITEIYSISYDDQKNVLLVGTQDNGTDLQPGEGQLEWKQVDTGDGGFTGIELDNYYYESDGLQNFINNIDGSTHQRYFDVNAQPSPNNLAAVESGNVPFAVPFKLDAAGNVGRIVLAMKTNLYESLDGGATAALLGPFAAGQGTALVYGGVSQGQSNADLIISGAGTKIFLRTQAGQPLTQVAGYNGVVVRALVADRNSWKTVFVLDSNANVWMTPDITSGQPFQKLTFNLQSLVGNPPLAMEQVLAQDGRKILVVGGGTAPLDFNGVPLPGASSGGIYQLLFPNPSVPGLNLPGPTWEKLGGNLPNALVTDLHYNYTDDVLVVGTFGRSAYTMHGIGSKIGQPGVIDVEGDDDPTHPNDNVVLSLDPVNPLLLDVTLNGGPPVREPVTAVSLITVNLKTGANTLTVDFRNGVFNVPAGIHFDGGGNGTLVVFDNNPNIAATTYNASGPSSGTVTPDGTAISFTNLSPVFVHNTSVFTLTTPSSGNNLTLDTPAAGQIRVSGASAGVAFENATVDTSQHIVLNLATNDTSTEHDAVSTTAAALLAVPTTDVTLHTGTNVPGNVLNLDAQGHDINFTQSTIQVVGAEPFYFDTLGTINLNNAGNVTVYGVAASDRLVVTAASTVSGTLRLNIGPLVVFNTLSSLHFVSNGGGDSFTIHNPAGTIFSPAGGIQFDSGDQAGMLNLDGGGGPAFIENDNNGPAAWAGNLAFAGPAGVTISVTGVAHISDTVPVGQLIDNGTDAANTITLDDGSALGDGKIRTTIDNFPVIEFGNKTNLIINAGLTSADLGNLIYVNYHEIPTGLTAVTINGGAGNDAIRVFASPVVPTVINTNAGNDLVAVKSDLTVPFTINGGSGNDTIYGGAGNSLINGGTGNNVLRAYGGNATIDSNGTDLIYTGDGNVTVNGGAGAETVYSGAGNDVIHGDQRYNIIHAGDGNTAVFGGPSGNLIFGGAGNDTLHGGAGNDTLYGGPGNDQLFGEGGNDLLVAGTGPTSLNGGSGSSTLVGGSGPETMQGGDGNNEINAGPSTTSITVGNGNSVILGGAAGEIIQAGSGDNVIVGPVGGGATITATGPSHIWGQGGHNTITGSSGADTLDAGSGGHNVLNGSGADILFGRDPTDVLNGASASYVYANSTLPDALPSYPAPQTGIASGNTLPSGADYFGCWTELASSATGTGLSGLAGFSSQPSVTAGASGQYVAWTDQRSGTFSIYVAQHTAAGWQQLAGSAQGGGISGTQGSAEQPSLTLDAAGNPLVAWTETTAAGSDVQVADYNPAANGGQGGWVALGNSLSPGGISGDGKAQTPVVVNTAGGPVVAWSDSSGGAANVYVEQFTGGAWTALGTGAASGTGVSGAAGGASDLALTTDGTKVAVSWTQLVSGIRQVYVKEYSGGSWNQLAGSASGAGISHSTSDSRAPTLVYQSGT